MVAVAETPVGVDVQFRDASLSLSNFSHYCLTASETDALKAIPAPHKDAVFFDLWSAKEAVVKADGRGMTMGLDCVEFDPMQLARNESLSPINRSRDAHLDDVRVMLFDVERTFPEIEIETPAGSYSAAVASLDAREFCFKSK